MILSIFFHSSNFFLHFRLGSNCSFLAILFHSKNCFLHTFYLNCKHKSTVNMETRKLKNKDHKFYQERKSNLSKKTNNKANEKCEIVNKFFCHFNCVYNCTVHAIAACVFVFLEFGCVLEEINRLFECCEGCLNSCSVCSTAQLFDTNDGNSRNK